MNILAVMTSTMGMTRKMTTAGMETTEASSAVPVDAELPGPGILRRIQLTLGLRILKRIQ
jgi:hypothetical protein